MLCAVFQFGFAQDAPGNTPGGTLDEADILAADAREESGGRVPETEFLFTETAGETDFSAGPSVFALLRVILILALVAAAIYGLIFFLRKQSAGRLQSDPYLKVLARTAVTPKAAAVVLSVGDKAWLAGITDEQVSLITEITDKEVVDAMLLDAANREIAAQSRHLDFRSLLARLSGGFARQPSANTSAGISPGGIRAQTDRLGRL